MPESLTEIRKWQSQFLDKVEAFDTMVVQVELTKILAMI